MAHAFYWALIEFYLSSVDSHPEQVPIFYRPSAVQEKYQTQIVSQLHRQSCRELSQLIAHAFYCEFAIVLTNANYIRANIWLYNNWQFCAITSFMPGTIENIKAHCPALGTGLDGCPKSACDWHSMKYVKYSTTLQ